MEGRSKKDRPGPAEMRNEQLEEKSPPKRPVLEPQGRGEAAPESRPGK